MVSNERAWLVWGRARGRGLDPTSARALGQVLVIESGGLCATT